MMRRRQIQISLERARRQLLDMFAGIPDEMLTYRPEGKGNHVLWLVGHIAVSDDQVISWIDPGKVRLKPQYHELFATGTEPRDDAAVYPPFPEVVHYMNNRRQAIFVILEEMSDLDLDDPPRGEGANFAEDIGDLLWTAFYHEAFHTGQLAAIRKCLGLRPVLF